MSIKLRNSLIISHVTVALFAIFFINTLIYVAVRAKVVLPEQPPSTAVNDTVDMFKSYLSDNQLTENEIKRLNDQSDKIKVLASVTDNKVNQIFIMNAIVSIFFGLLIALAFFRKLKGDIIKTGEMAAHLNKGSVRRPNIIPKYEDFLPIINDLKALQKRLEKNEALKKRMTADYAHELRTPLTNLQAHLEALIEGVWEPSKERYQSCHEEVLRLIRLVGNLEQLSKYEDEKLVLDKSEFDLTELIKNIHVNFQGELNSKNILYTFKGTKELIYADRDKISQVMVNLFSNSIKYTLPLKGKILVSVEGDNQYIYIFINDNGIGIPSQDVPNIFKRLYRSDISRNRDSGGAGIGLAIAKAIVEAHLGSIEVVSQVGVGTEFTIILPRK